MVEMTVGKKVGWSAAWLAEKLAGVLVVLMAARWVGETDDSLVALRAESLDQKWVVEMVWTSAAWMVGMLAALMAAPMAGTWGANWVALRVGHWAGF